jgi:hypothetical protein
MISFTLVFLLNYSELIKAYFFMVFNLYNFSFWFVIINGLKFSPNNYNSLVYIMNRSNSFQFDFSFLELGFNFVCEL